MGIIDKLFGKKEPATEIKPEKTAEAPKVKKPRATKPKVKSPKELANERNEPWVSIVSVEIDPNNIGSGAFELDWNDKFVANLVRAGYKGKTDQQIVDQWFQDVCRNVVLENFEQEMADPDMRQSRSRKLDDGRTEFS